MSRVWAQSQVWLRWLGASVTYVILMLVTGCLIALQSPINAALGRFTGALEASLVNFAVGFAALAAAVAFFGRGSVAKACEAPWWQWSGGVLGAVMVFSAVVSVPRIGVLATVLCMILGNLLMASVIDNFGWFGLPLHPFSLRRLLGFCLALAGLYFIFQDSP